MRESLDRQAIERIVRAIGDRLAGDWLLVGGALVSLWLDSRRMTEDLDVIGMTGTQQERFALMQVASDLGLPIEAVNSAADFFVQRIPGWRQEVEPLLRGARGTVFRPTPTLFLMLKAARLSAQDLADCEAMLEKARSEKLAIDGARVRQWVEALPIASDPALAERRERLSSMIDR